MTTHRRGYFLKDGSRVPGTTTIIGRFKESGPLLRWAYAQGRMHEALANQGSDAPSSLYDGTDSAAEIGTVTHAMVERHLDGEGEETIEKAIRDAHGQSLYQKARGSYDAYLAWEQQTRLKIIAQEIPLVSETHRFGGRPDAIGEINGEICILDWKTSNRVYTDH